MSTVVSTVQVLKCQELVKTPEALRSASLLWMALVLECRKHCPFCMVQRKQMVGFLQVKSTSPVRVFGRRASMMESSVDNDNSEIALDCRQLAPDHEVEIVVDEPF